MLVRAQWKPRKMATTHFGYQRFAIGPLARYIIRPLAVWSCSNQRDNLGKCRNLEPPKRKSMGDSSRGHSEKSSFEAAGTENSTLGDHHFEMLQVLETGNFLE
jgi:hypothetical protein